MIRAPKTLPIADVTYRKELIAQHFFLYIRQLADIEFVSTGDLIFTIASYFYFKVGTAKVQSERVATDIFPTFFKVDNLTGIGSL